MSDKNVTKTNIKDTFSFAVIAIMGVLVYSNTLNVPWYFDDFPNIVQNAGIRNLETTFQNLGLARSVGNLTFALNFHFNGLSLPGYHIVNICIHIFASCLVFLLLKRVFRFSYLLPLAGGLIFLVHPIQTQAITYVVQRFASLCGLLFFLSLYFHIRAREIVQSKNRFFSYQHLFMCGLVLVFGIAAMLTKQNAVILPIAILLFDIFYLKTKKETWMALAPYILPLLFISIFITLREVLYPILTGTSIQDIGSQQNFIKANEASPIKYLFTEFSVLWLYIRLLFLPFGQTLDYGYPIVKTLINVKSMTALAGLIVLFALGIKFRQRHKSYLFGIVWFFLALSVESTLIPLDTVFEHRLYVPIFGFIIIVLESLNTFYSKNFKVGALLIIVLILSFLAWHRNALWADPLAFQEDNLRKAPHNQRVYVSLSKIYIENKRYNDALRILKKAEKIMPLDSNINHNLGVIYANTGDKGEAVNCFKKAIALDPSHTESYINLGAIYDELGEWEKARAVYLMAVSLSPHNEHVLTEVGMFYEHIASYNEAEKMHRKAISALPGFGTAHFNLGVSLYKQGRKKEALKEFDLAHKLMPLHLDSLYNSGVVSIEIGDVDAANAAVLKLEKCDLDRAEELRSEIRKSGR